MSLSCSARCPKNYTSSIITCMNTCGLVVCACALLSLARNRYTIFPLHHFQTSLYFSAYKRGKCSFYYVVKWIISLKFSSLCKVCCARCPEIVQQHRIHRGITSCQSCGLLVSASAYWAEVLMCMMQVQISQDSFLITCLALFSPLFHILCLFFSLSFKSIQQMQ